MTDDERGWFGAPPRQVGWLPFRQLELRVSSLPPPMQLQLQLNQHLTVAGVAAAMAAEPGGPMKWLCKSGLTFVRLLTQVDLIACARDIAITPGVTIWILCRISYFLHSEFSQNSVNGFL